MTRTPDATTASTAALREVSYTSQWTAAARALETEREGERLFEDPYARELAAPKGFELLDKYGGGGLREFVAIRTRYLDDAIREALADTDIRQVVLIAAGMDTRAFRLTPLPDDVTVYEVDHADLLTEKRRRLERLGAQPTVRRQEVGADLATDWLPALTTAGFDPGRPTLWIPEALLFFLTEEQSSTLLRTLRSASAPGSRLAVDILSRSLLVNPATQLFLAALRKDGIPWLFGTDEPAGFLAGNGWTVREVKEPGQAGAGEGRWPYEVQPPNVPGVARNWLITAEPDSD
ncbi:SAM-dependent methyltransferase [Nocardia sp. BMG51109]|uniref:class I SAM-dependent methyltransferase n=1 Tax=Nocardia sp. BMG51109 TaxID=1056816 RepID=UPI0004B2569A|nr:SAM-dependent methyltransferase [Nocardia sp. BMG51109]